MAKKAPLEFWFDFSSPYAYIASTQIDDMADDHQRTVRWRPFLLGAVMKASGGAPLVQFPMKAAYMMADIERFARLYGLPYQQPTPFPIATIVAARAFYWIEQNEPAKANDFAAVVFAAYFEQGRDISQAEVILDIAEKMKIDRAALETGLADAEIKQKLKAACDEAIDRKIFGAPWVVVDDQSFWGADRLWMVEEWLESGGW